MSVALSAVGRTIQMLPIRFVAGTQRFVGHAVGVVAGAQVIAGRGVALQLARYVQTECFREIGIKDVHFGKVPRQTVCTLAVGAKF